MSNGVLHTKCKKCKSIKNIADLKEELESKDLVCKDVVACEIKAANNKEKAKSSD